ncbi:MAG: lysylphosphatidylglycerol synthase transmembrane domain-containing protein [Methanoregula sp.]|nr:MAG: lysylphosphatidylglycerol synthase transmembrane domain-containing protein [Methanoregula sp.]
MYRKVSAILVPTLIAIGILAYMLFNVWGDLLDALTHIVPLYLVIALIICLAAWWLRGWRYHTILAYMDNTIRVRVATGCIFVSQTANLVIPARLGDFVRIFILNHENQTSYSDGLSSIVVERVFDIATVALLGLISLIFILDADPAYFLIISLVLALCGVFFIFLYFANTLRSNNRYIKFVLTMLHEIRRASLTPQSVIVLGFSSMVIWILDALVCMAVVMMFEQNIPFVTVVLAIVIGNLIKAVPITPGGIGTYEFFVANIFILAGAAPAVATLIAVIDHLIKNLVTLAGGIISIYFFGDWVVPTIKKALTARVDGGTTTER